MILGSQVLYKYLKPITCSADEDQPIVHVGEDKLFPQGNCAKHGCTVCTPWDQCEPCNDYKRTSQRKRKRKSDDNPIISDSEKAILRAFRQQEKYQDNGDWGPI
jgi:hypothetical protein